MPTSGVVCDAVEHELPVSARAGWWLGAWTRGGVSPDEVMDALGPGAVLTAEGGHAPLVELLSLTKATGVSRIGVALPAEGDPYGLGGPQAFNAAAIEAGEALLIGETGLVPHEDEGIEWLAHAAARRQPGDVGEMDRNLRSTVLEAADALARLDVARWRPDVADELLDLRAQVPLDAPDAIPPVCVRLAGTALRMLHICDLALADDGGAVSASEAELRRAAVLPLERAARRALATACSPDGWPS